MGPRASLTSALALAVPLLLVGCGDDGSSITPSADMGMGGGHDMGLGCAVVHVSAVNAVTGAPTSDVPARLLAYVDVIGASGPQWTLMHTGDPNSITPDKTDAGGFHVQKDVTEPGTWTFEVSFASGPCRGFGSYTLNNPSGATQTYRFRALPPETSGYPLTEIIVPITGGVSGVVKNLTLDPGTAVSGTLRLAGAPTAGEVRLIADDGPDAVGLAGSDGAFKLAVQALGSYTALLIPDPRASSRAPHLGAHGQGVSFVGATFDIPGGVAVSGSVVDGAATAIAGAHVVLRAGALPSGTGLSNAGGGFTLYAEPATYALTFDAPDWPQATASNVVVPAGGTSLAIAYTTPRVAVGGSVVGDDGTTPAAFARVTLTSRPLGNVADVSVGGAAAVHAAGRVARVVMTDANGALPAMKLPPGTYDLIVEPAAPAIDGLTAITEVLAGPATWTLKLDKPVPLSVTVTGSDGKGVAGVQLTAIETVGLGAAPVGVTDTSGNHVFVIDKGAPLELLVEPPGASSLAGTRVAVAANAGSVAVALGRGLLVSGVVQTPTNDPQIGVRVEALCLSCGSVTPVATSISDAHGIYRLYLPDPGNLIVDGGAGD